VVHLTDLPSLQFLVVVRFDLLTVHIELEKLYKNAAKENMLNFRWRVMEGHATIIRKAVLVGWSLTSLFSAGSRCVRIRLKVTLHRNRQTNLYHVDVICCDET